MAIATDTEGRLSGWRRRFEQALDRVLPAVGSEPQTLHEAMRYSALSGGKRVRPMLVYAAGQAVGVTADMLDTTACAVELIHAYSLIHDDLPAMDDDALRRGRPTCHLAFDEATAILAGDALQALAFESLSNQPGIPPAVGLQLLSGLAQACGSSGMAGGQVLDLQLSGGIAEISHLEHIHELKTGALIRFSVVAPAVIAGCTGRTLSALDRFGSCVGLGFQIRDDILDVTGDAQETGKLPHADALRNKPTYPALVGLDDSHRAAERLRDEALSCLEIIQGDTSSLAWLANYMISRNC